MSITRAFSIVILLSALSHAQLPEAPHKFWDGKNKTMFVLDAAAKSYDGFMTHRGLQPYRVKGTCQPDIDPGPNGCLFDYTVSKIDGDPIARPFVKTTAGQVAYFSASLAADAGIAYLFHKSGHHKLERITLGFGAAQSIGFASSWTVNR